MRIRDGAPEPLFISVTISGFERSLLQLISSSFLTVISFHGRASVIFPVSSIDDCSCRTVGNGGGFVNSGYRNLQIAGALCSICSVITLHRFACQHLSPSDIFQERPFISVRAWAEGEGEVVRRGAFYLQSQQVVKKP